MLQHYAHKDTNRQAFARRALIGVSIRVGVLAVVVLLWNTVDVLLEHPDMPVLKSWLGYHPTLRRVPLGLVMGAYIAGVVYLFGKRSGAHINPAVTGAFLRLGKIKAWDALFYILAQFAGAILAVQLLALALGEWYAHPSVDYVVTKPDKTMNGTQKAFVAEFIISFVLMFAVLVAINAKRLEKYAALITGVLLAIYLIVETPYSGMSLNPARSTASAVAAHHWMDLWLYFVSPMLAMLLAAETFLLLKKVWLRGASWHKESPSYPVEEAPAT